MYLNSVYALSMAWIYIIYLMPKKFQSQFILITPVVLLGTFRGSAGKDTGLYILRFENMSFEAFNWLDFSSEPIFNILIFACKSILDKPEFFFFIHSSLLGLLFLKAVSNWDRTIVFLLLLAPSFLLDGVLNGMRIGLAMLVLVVAFVYGNRLLKILTIGIHFSSAIALIIKLFLDKGLVRASLYLAIFLSLILFLIPMVDFETMRFFIKLNDYSEIHTKSVYSGLSDVTICGFLVSLFYLSRSRLDFSSYMIAIVILFLSTAVLFYMTSISWALLRVIKIIALVLSLDGKIVNYVRGRPIVLSFTFTLGLLYSLNFLRAVYFGPGFLPYGS